MAPPYIIGHVGSSTTVTNIPTTTPPSAGDTWVAAVGGDGNTAGSLGDTKTNSYTSVSLVVTSGTFVALYGYPTSYPPIELVSGNTINNTSSGGAEQQGIAIGVPGSTGVDATSGTVASETAGTTATCNSITPSNASDLVVAIFFMLDTSVITVTPAGGFTLLGGAGINDGTGSPSVYVTYLANAGTGALTPSISWTGNHTATSMAYSFGIPASGGQGLMIQRKAAYGQQ